MSKLAFYDTATLMAEEAHGWSPKSLIVLHETVSGDIPGWQDISTVEAFLARKGYGIHGMTDAEGHIAWALGMGRAIFYHAGGVNTKAIGIEQVSNVMLRSPVQLVRRKIWAARQKQLRSTAKLLAAISHAQNIPLRYVAGDGKLAGVTSHYDVSKFFAASEGHSDCWPVNEGGYYPMAAVLTMARAYKKLGVTF